MKRVLLVLMLLALPLAAAVPHAQFLVSGEVVGPMQPGSTVNVGSCVDREFTFLELDASSNANVVLQGQVYRGLEEGQTVTITDSPVTYLEYVSGEPLAQVLVNGEVIGVAQGETKELGGGSEVSVLLLGESSANVLVDGQVTGTMDFGETVQVGESEVSVLSVKTGEPAAKFLVDGSVTDSLVAGETQDVRVCDSKEFSFLELTADDEAKVLVQGEVSNPISLGETVEFAGEEITFLEFSEEDKESSEPLQFLVSGEVLSAIEQGETVRLSDISEFTVLLLDTNVYPPRAKVMIDGEVSEEFSLGQTIKLAGKEVTLLRPEAIAEPVVDANGNDSERSWARHKPYNYTDGSEKPVAVCDGIMYIQNDQTGECKQTMTSCDLEKQTAPDGWTKVDECPDVPIDAPEQPERPQVDDQDQEEQEKPDSCGSGCMLDGSCVDIGYRSVVDGAASFCSASGEFVAQKSLDASCQNSFECSTNECSSGSCVDLQQQLEEQRGLLERILSWFGGIFG